MRHRGRFGIMLLVLFSAALAKPAENSSLPSAMANDNQTPAGQLKNGVLNLQLGLCQGRWYPEDEGGGYRDVYAFAEGGHAPQISGPLIRVQQGTKIHATIHNALALPAKIYGLHTHPGDAKDALNLDPVEAPAIVPPQHRRSAPPSISTRCWPTAFPPTRSMRCVPSSGCIRPSWSVTASTTHLRWHRRMSGSRLAPAAPAPRPRRLMW